ncbi:MAG: ABC transporter substrate-binding protein [Chloroflexota bacterium]
MSPEDKRLNRRDFLRTTLGAGALVAGSAALAACASPAASPASTAAPKAAETAKPVAAATQAPAPSKQPVELSWIWTSNTAEEQKFWEGQAAGFRTKYPNVTVKPQFLGGNDLYNKIQTLASGGTIPDIIFWNGSRVQSWASRKMALSLEPFIKRDNFDLADFDPQISKALSYKGELYGLAYDYGAPVVAFNMDLFDATGVPYPTADWTWADFLAIAQKLTKDTNGDGKTDQWGFVNHTDFFRGFVSWIWSNGGDYVNDDITKCVLDSPETAEAIQFVADLRVKHKVNPPIETGYTSGAEAFYSGKVGMYIDGPWMALNNRAKAKFNWDFALIPKGKAGRKNWISGTGYAIGRTTKYPEEAWAFCKELTSVETLSALATAGRGFPGRKSASNSYLKVKPPVHPEVAIEAVKSATYQKTTATFQEMNNVLNKAVDRVMLGEIKAAQMVKDVMPEMDDLMKKHLQLINA